MTSYSKYWRTNYSKDKATELAFGLRALRKVAGYLGQNVKSVYWEGMIDPELKSSSIIINTKQIKNNYPIASNTFDIMVGQVLKDGIASIEWTEWVYEKVYSRSKYMSDLLEPYFKSIFNASEYIYVYEYTKKEKIWNLYLLNFIKNKIQSNSSDPFVEPTHQSLADIWIEKKILNKTYKSLHFYFLLPLGILNKYTAKIQNIVQIKSVGERRDTRIDIYIQLWNELAAVILKINNWILPYLPPSLILENQNEKKINDPDDPDDNQSDSCMDKDIANQILEEVDHEKADITVNIIKAVSDPQSGIMPTIFKKGMAKSNTKPDMQQVAKLKHIFKTQISLIRRAKKRRFKRGMLEGKLDPKRLYRSPIDGRVFKLKESKSPDYFWHICIVADASASMTGKEGHNRPWLIAEQAFVSLAAAAKGFNNHLDIFSYCEDKKSCVLTQLFYGDTVYSVLPTGQTPSGQAILGAAIMLNKRYKNNMIIHITDGASNCGIRISSAISYCNKNNIDLYTIGCGCNLQTRQFLSQYFPPKNLFFMNNINSLAVGLERLFTRTMLVLIK